MNLPYQNQKLNPAKQIPVMVLASLTQATDYSTAVPPLTFEQLIPLFADYVIYDLRYSPKTAKKYTESLRWIMRDLPRMVYPQDLTLTDVTELKKRILLRGAKECRVNSILFPLRKFLTYCSEVHQLATINPQDIKPMKIPKREVDFLKEDEINQFVSAMDTSTATGLRMRTLIEVLLSTAMRISEALSINRDDIDWEGKEVTIIGKGNKQRSVFLNDRAIGWLQAYLLRRTDDHSALFVTFGKAKRLAPYDLSKQFKHYAEKANLKKRVTPHTLRHTAATIMSIKGADIRVIQQILGHSDIETTARYYLGVDKQALKEAHAKFLNYG
jgi:integrase/recombinase XerD